MGQTVSNTMILRDKVSAVVQNISKNIKKMSDQAKESARGASDAFGSMAMAITGVNQGLQLVSSGLTQVRNVAGIADEYTLIGARLDLITNNAKELATLQEDIFQAAQRSRGSYTTMAGSISKMGILAKDAFKTNDELIGFTETLNKAFVVGGASAMEQASGIYQITQAMAAGRLQGDEFRAVLENAPLMAQAIADYTGKSIGELKLMSAEGTISADIMKNALFKASKQINDQFKTIPVTFGQAWNMGMNVMMKGLQPLIKRFSDWVNSGGAEKMEALFIKVGKAIMVAGSAIMFIAENWNYIYPLIIGGLAVMAWYYITTGTAAFLAGLRAAAGWALANWQMLAIIGVITLMAMFWQDMGKVAQAVCIGIAIGLGIVQLAALGITWPFLLIIAIIAIVVSAFVFFGDEATKACEYVGGAVGVMISFIYNNWMFLWNYIASFIEFFANAWHSPIYSIKKLFFNLFDTVMGIIKSMASAIDKVLGTDMSKGLGNIQSKMQKIADRGKKPKYYVTIPKAKYMDMGKAFETGKKWGKSAGQTATDFLGGLGDKAKGLADKAKKTFTPKGGNIPFEKFPGSASNPTKLDKGTKVGINGDVSIKDEDLKYLRDVSRVKFVNRYTSLKPVVNAKFGDVRESADVNKIIDHIASSLEKATASALR